MLAEEELIRQKFERKVQQVEQLEQQQEHLLAQIRSLGESERSNNLLPAIAESNSMSSSYSEDASRHAA